MYKLRTKYAKNDSKRKSTLFFMTPFLQTQILSKQVLVQSAPFLYNSKSVFARAASYLTENPRLWSSCEAVLFLTGEESVVRLRVWAPKHTNALRKLVVTCSSPKQMISICLLLVVVPFRLQEQQQAEVARHKPENFLSKWGTTNSWSHFFPCNSHGTNVKITKSSGCHSAPPRSAALPPMAASISLIWDLNLGAGASTTIDIKTQYLLAELLMLTFCCFLLAFRQLQLVQWNIICCWRTGHPTR